MATNGKPHTAPRPGALHVAFVLDESGSMERLARAVVTGFDEFVDELREDGGETLLTLTTFDTEFRHLHLATPLDQVSSLADTGYRPGGMTALFDAVAHAILDTDRRLTEQGCAHEKVMLVVMTDGLENSSTDYTAERLSRLVASYDARPNWTFVYLGAAHDTLEDARDLADRLAFKRANAMRWTPDAASAHRSMRSLATAARHRRADLAMKSEQLFADAGQSESDYLADDATGEPDPPMSRRPFGDMLGRSER
ncbi:MAG: vWA domain-containing protein [Gaiellales bacterium]